MIEENNEEKHGASLLSTLLDFFTTKSYALNLFILALFGIIVKVYDDLDELYLSTDKYTLALLQCVQLVIVCLWLFVFVENKFDILVLLDGCSIGMFDWEAYAMDAFFYAFTICITFICFFMFIMFGWSFSLREIFINYTIGYLFSSPIPELLCMKFNGPFHSFTQWMNWSPKNKESSTFIDISESELEVSHFKLKIRIYSVLYLITAFFLMQYLKTLVAHDSTWFLLMTSWSYLNLCLTFYFLVSIFNQYNVLYNHPEILEMHQNKNKTVSVNESSVDYNLDNEILPVVH